MPRNALNNIECIILLISNPHSSHFIDLIKGHIARITWNRWGIVLEPQERENQ